MNALPRNWNIWTLWRQFKKIVFTGGSDNLLAKHNKAMFHINFMTRKIQDIQEDCDQYVDILKVCTETGTEIWKMQRGC